MKLERLSKLRLSTLSSFASKHSLKNFSLNFQVWSFTAKLMDQQKLDKQRSRLDLLHTGKLRAVRFTVLDATDPHLREGQTQREITNASDPTVEYVPDSPCSKHQKTELVPGFRSQRGGKDSWTRGRFYILHPKQFGGEFLRTKLQKQGCIPLTNCSVEGRMVFLREHDRRFRSPRLVFYVGGAFGVVLAKDGTRTTLGTSQLSLKLSC